MRISLRRQIFLWYALVIPVIVVGLAFIAQKVIVDGVRTTLDRHLQERTEVVANTIILNPDLSPAAYEDLIEFLIIVAILGILVVVVIPKLARLLGWC